MNSVIREFTLLSTSTSLALYGMQGPYLAKPLIQKECARTRIDSMFLGGCIPLTGRQYSMTDMFRLDSTS
jgi:hypothetical protein